MKSAIFGSGYFLNGFAPIQMLVEMACIVALFIFIGYIAEKYMRIKMNKFFQATALLGAAMLYLKYRVSPPLPFSILAMYMTIIASGIFVWVSATPHYWKNFCGLILQVIDANTPTTRTIRASALVLLPLLVAVLGFNSLKPDAIEAPVQLRMYHPAPPPVILVYPPERFVGKHLTESEMTRDLHCARYPACQE